MVFSSSGHAGSKEEVFLNAGRDRDSLDVQAARLIYDIPRQREIGGLQ